jgi:hypothetical protein
MVEYFSTLFKLFSSPTRQIDMLLYSPDLQSIKLTDALTIENISIHLTYATRQVDATGCRTSRAQIQIFSKNLNGLIPRDHDQIRPESAVVISEQKDTDGER